ncbi:hypothetical protein [Bordetella bronchiseptica]|uniref:hypothetical protein n=1 Tax=Bordetella bronchiseptica TaxID=518 RepID=UPI0004A12916|nr:hypothetical protein [Bordetella bronchiseptica]KDB68218.1 hypothetical protein AZ21_0517 [Bordetella bronchiseptica B20-10725633]
MGAIRPNHSSATRSTPCSRNVGTSGNDGLRRSREAFINSLRNTGLTYAQAQVKYDNCLDEQQQLHQQAIHELQYAERLHRQLLAELEQTA